MTKQKKKCARHGCKVMFDPKTTWQKYCSRTCKQIAWHLKQAKGLSDNASLQLEP